MSKFTEHVKNNKKFYIGLGVGVTVGTISALVISNRVAIAQIVIGSGNTTIQVNDLSRRMHPGFEILVNETGERFASIRRTADVLGIKRSDISKQLAGDLTSVGGYTFTNLGEM